MWEQRDSSSPDIRTVWRAFVDEPHTYTVPASEFWGISFARQANGLLRAELDGPSLTSRTVASVRGEWYWGVELGAHVAVAGVDKSQILGLTVNLPMDDDRVAVGGHWLQVPEWRQAEDFVARLIGVGSLVVDPYVRRALQGDEDGYSPRRDPGTEVDRGRDSRGPQRTPAKLWADCNRTTGADAVCQQLRR
jgi:hypothetical protein